MVVWSKVKRMEMVKSGRLEIYFRSRIIGLVAGLDVDTKKKRGKRN